MRRPFRDTAVNRQDRGGEPPRVRIIGGRLRGRPLPYSGDPRTRPMKDRVREAVFNLLGHAVEGTDAVDLFAGTGALGLEALSRGAAHATLIERHRPTAERIRLATRQLGIETQATVLSCDAFFWMRHDWQPGTRPTLLFCSPPYAFFGSRRNELLEVFRLFAQRAATGSCLVIESDTGWMPQELPLSLDWDTRDYPPAIIAIGHKLSPAISPEAPISE